MPHPIGIRVRGRVDERMFFGPKLELWTEVATEPGSSGFAVSDQLTNQGSYDQEFEVTPLLWTVYGFRIKPHLSASIHS